MTTSQHDLASDLLRQGRLDEAARVCESALSVNPDDGPLLNVLGVVNLHRRRHGEALVAFRRHCQVAPSDPAAWYNLGVAQQASALDPDSLTSFGRAVELRGGLPYGDAHLAACIAAMRVGTAGARGAAQQHGRFAVEQLPTSPDARMWYAKALTAGNDKAGAAREFRAALALRPDFVEALEGLIDALLEQGELATAIPHLDRILELRPDHPTARAERNRVALAVAPASASKRPYSVTARRSSP